VTPFASRKSVSTSGPSDFLLANGDTEPPHSNNRAPKALNRKDRQEDIMFIIVTGRVQVIEELAHTDNGCYIDFAIPVEYPVRTGDGTKYYTKWYNFRAFNGQAETIARLVKKGTLAEVVADLKGYLNGGDKPVEQYRLIQLKPLENFGKKKANKGESGHYG
jgi:single-stranded DNA-binding protein